MSVYDPFAARYDDWAADMTEDVPFYVELARETEGSLVELAVGNGRVAIPVARETGRAVLGLDISPAMLEQARERADAAGCRARAPARRHARPRAGRAGRPDLRPRSAPCSTCPPGPTGGGCSSASSRRCDRAGASPGTPSSSTRRIAARIDGEWQEQNGIRHRIDQAKHDNRIDITLESGDAISLWWLNRSEWEGLIEVAGFEVEALYGGFAREPFDESANEFVWVVRKPV